MHDIDSPTDARDTHILVVDDEESLREILSEVLAEEGHRVSAAASAEQALMLLSDRHIDIVITDIRMPGMNGIDLLRKIKEKNQETQVIVITSHASLDSALAALRAGAYDYLFKPFEDLELIPAVVNRALEKMQLLREKKILVETLQKYNEELEEVNKILRELAIRDGLTGLYNHRYFHETLVMESARSRRHQQRFSLLFIDIDHFRQYNDLHGHPLGDQLLRNVSEILKSRLRHSDVAARYGGEEFALLLPETDRQGALIVAEHIREQIASFPFQGGAALPAGKVTVSIGVAVFPEDGAEVRDVLQQAEQALHKAKCMGRNQTKTAGA